MNKEISKEVDFKTYFQIDIKKKFFEQLRTATALFEVNAILNYL